MQRAVELLTAYVAGPGANLQTVRDDVAGIMQRADADLLFGLSEVCLTLIQVRELETQHDATDTLRCLGHTASRMAAGLLDDAPSERWTWRGGNPWGMG